MHPVNHSGFAYRQSACSCLWRGRGGSTSTVPPCCKSDGHRSGWAVCACYKLFCEKNHSVRWFFRHSVLYCNASPSFVFCHRPQPLSGCAMCCVSAVEENDLDVSNVVSCVYSSWSVRDLVPTCFRGEFCFVGYFKAAHVSCVLFFKQVYRIIVYSWSQLTLNER
jgi:hypothetical protein